MATLGYTSIGVNQIGSSSGSINPNGLLITVPSSGQITKITAYVAESISSASLACALYSGSAGSRGSLITNTNSSTVTTTFAWVDFTFASAQNVTAQTYWLQFNGDGGGGPGTNIASIKYDTGGATNSGYDLLDNGTPQYETNQYSMYATFTPTTGRPVATGRLSATGRKAAGIRLIATGRLPV